LGVRQRLDCISGNQHFVDDLDRLIGLAGLGTHLACHQEKCQKGKDALAGVMQNIANHVEWDWLVQQKKV
jgi:hypothetical protein